VPNIRLYEAKHEEDMAKNKYQPNKEQSAVREKLQKRYYGEAALI
jgi:hypothetical protein